MTRIEKIKAIIADTDKNYAPYYDVLPNLIKERGYKSGIEIGVFCGGHAERILQTGCSLIGIDPYEMYEPGMPLLDSQDDWDELYYEVMNRLYAYPSQYLHFKLYSNNSINEIKNNDYELFDFIFHDSLHTYENLKWELENYEPLIRTGGVIACHDYNHPYFPDLTTAIDEFAAKHNAKVNIGPLHFIHIDKTW